MNATPPQTILIADDEIYMLRLLEMTFKKGGYSVVSCRDGREALATAATARPQLIVLDVMMPGLDGLGALRQLKENPATRDIPVVVLSAKGHALTKVEAEAGRRGVVPRQTIQSQPASRRGAEDSRAAKPVNRRAIISA